ncbi:MAG TPA: ATP-binding protein [Rhodanobacteraceae bacterium]|nr:ATP-binding protein [Rhodanobacteraceae bacterium]
MRNPLSPITTTLELMKMRAPDVFAREHGIIEAQVRHLTGLVDDLLDVARIASGKLELKREPVDIKDIVSVAVQAIQPVMEERRQSLHTELANGLTVSGDKRRLVQVLINLLTNAARYSPPDRAIYLSATDDNRQVVLRVRDEGQGIDAELLPHVFELFTQAAQSTDRAPGGLGLGLAIVSNLVRMHGGTVEVASAGRDKGSEFTVRLPLLKRRRIRDKAVSPAAIAPGPERHAEKARVLIVDDYPEAAESLALLLNEMGYQTHAVHDGAAALKALAEFGPQIALVDIGMPVIDGYELAGLVRSTPGCEHLPLVAITGYGQVSDQAKVKAAGFDQHLVKPLDAWKLGKLIDRLVAASGTSDDPTKAFGGRAASTRPEIGG